MLNRAFGKLAKGSLRGSIFALCASAIGSGVLSLPYVLALNGWVLGFIFIITGAIGNEISINDCSCMLESLYDSGICNKSEGYELFKVSKLCWWKKA